VLYTRRLRRSFFPMLVFWGFCLVFLCKFFPLITVYRLVAASSQVFPILVGRDSLSLVHYLRALISPSGLVVVSDALFFVLAF
jgi:hypothetical protein